MLPDMPTLEFYAAGDDGAALLRLIRRETSLEVHELADTAGLRVSLGPPGVEWFVLLLPRVEGRSLVPASINQPTRRPAQRVPGDVDARAREAAGLQRLVRQLASGQVGPRLVLPGAEALFRAGVEPARRTTSQAP